MNKLRPLEIYVNLIEEDGEIIHGYAALDNTVLENLSLIFQDRTRLLSNLLTLIKVSNEPFYTFTRYCQFVTFIQFEPILGLSMKLSDFNNNINSALDHYNSLKIKNWNKEDIDKILIIFQEIQNDKTNIARMVIRNPIA